MILATTVHAPAFIQNHHTRLALLSMLTSQAVINLFDSILIKKKLKIKNQGDLSLSEPTLVES